MTKVVFWQSMVSQHQAALVRELANLPGYDVIYIAVEEIDDARANMGWTRPDLGHAELVIAPDKSAIEKLANGFDGQAIHLCQGFRGNGLIAEALPLLANRKARIGVMLEAIDQRGVKGLLKKPLYRRRIKKYGSAVDFCLSIGAHADAFVKDCGYRNDRTFPFTYFLDPVAPGECDLSAAEFRVTYVGKLVQLKRVDLLLEAWKVLQSQSVTLTIVGAGPLEAELKAQAAAASPNGQIEWLGTLPAPAVSSVLQNSDCLVLPSEYDGWGAVVTEALNAGVPAICSTECGAAEAVRNSDHGSVFQSGDVGALAKLLEEQVALGRPNHSDRQRLATWAEGCLSGRAGAHYLDQLLGSIYQGAVRPTAPWLTPDSAKNP